MRILIVKTSSMGDVVHAAPLASDLAAHAPGAVIDWVVEESFAAIPRLHPAIADVIPIALRRWRESAFSPATWREIRAVRKRLRAADYDQVIDCQGLFKSAWVSRWARGSRTVVSGPDRNSAREPLAARFYDRPVAVARTLHAIERNRRIGADALGYAVHAAPRFGLQAPPLAKPEFIALFESALVAVVLTNASRATKLWPDGHWREVQHALAAARPGAHFVLTHMTPTGRSVGEGLAQSLPGRVTVRYLPYEFGFALQRFLREVRPALGIVMETEVWPNLLFAARASGVPVEPQPRGAQGEGRHCGGDYGQRRHRSAW